jgi:hypothetical protein
VAKVQVYSWNGEKMDTFVKLTEEILLPVLEKDISIGVPHGDPIELKKNGKFNIHIWSGVRGRSNSRKKQPPEHIYGTKVNCRDPAFEPFGNPGESQVFKCEQTNYAVAELFEDNLFIHHDICHHGTPSELKIYKKLLTEVACSLKISPEELAARTEIELQKMREKTSESRSAFMELYTSGTRSAILKADKEARQGRSRCEELKSEMVECEAKRSVARDRLEKFAECEKSGAIYGDEFDKMLTIPGVLGVSIENKILQVFTDMIRIVHEEVTYIIGKFRMEISMYAKEDEHCLRFFNLTNEGNGPGANRPGNFNGNADFNRHHPHVQHNGAPCLGNIKTAIRDYIHAGQYSVVVILAMQYLQSVNTEDSAGKGIYWWPKEIK